MRRFVTLTTISGVSLVLLFWLNMVASSWAAKPLKELGAQELTSEAATLMAANRCKDALPFLNEIVQRFSKLHLPAARQAVAWAYYNLAMAHAELKAYDEATKYCNLYLKEFPTGGLRVALLLLMAEVNAVQERWGNVLDSADKVLKERDLPFVTLIAANQLRGEAFFRQQKYEAALEPLSFVFRSTRDRDSQRQSAVMLTTCLVRLEKFEQLIQFMPVVQRSAAKFDVELNVALIEGGEANFDKGKYENALLLYRLVYLKDELRKAIQGLVAQAQRERESLFSQGLSAPEIVAARQRVDRIVKSYEDQLKEIEAFPDYDQDLIMRLARTYSALNRHWEALLLFRSIYEDYPKHPLAPMALYAAFTTAVAIPHHERAFAEGYEYLDVYPKGDYFDIVALTLAQVHIERAEFAKAVEVCERGLAGKPKGTLKDHLHYLAGFSLVNLEKYAEATKRFTLIIETFPTSVVVEPARYWRAMSLLFDTKYAEAAAAFRDFLTRCKSGQHHEDARFRLGVACYGADDFKAAEAAFKDFIKRFPEHQLVSEAYAMLGDIYGSWRELDEALNAFAKAQEKATTFVQLNYAFFQAARVYELESQYEKIIAMFQKYLKNWGERGNFTQAIYWISMAQNRSGKLAESLQTLFDAVVRYGDKPEHHGVDMMVRDLIAEREQLANNADFTKLLDRLNDELTKARDNKQRTLELRLTALFAETAKDLDQRTQLRASLVKEENIALAGPITLQVMGGEAVRSGKLDLARKIYDHFITVHEKSDLNLYAYEGLAEMDFDAGDYDKAERSLKEITTRYATTPEAAKAEKRLGDVYRMRKDYAKAIETYNLILGTREWRGELWPESLYWIGVCHLEQGKAQEAFAFFQRLYVLYEGFPVWAAKGYVKSAECLQLLNRRDEAIKTYQELLGKEAMNKLPEADAARQNLQKLGGNPT